MEDFNFSKFFPSVEDRDWEELYYTFEHKTSIDIMFALSKSTRLRNAEDVKKYGGFFLPPPDPWLMNMASLSYIHCFINDIGNCIKNRKPLNVDFDGIMLTATNELLNSGRIKIVKNEKAGKMIAEGMANAAFYCKEFLKSFQI